MLQQENRNLTAVLDSKDQEILELRSRLEPDEDAEENMIEGEVVQEED
jgi:hypothetical protein